MNKQYYRALISLVMLIVLLFLPLGISAASPTPFPISQPDQNLDAATFNALNPLVQHSKGVQENLATPGGIIQRVLRFAFPLAGLILFVMIVWAGFEMIVGATDKKSLDAGKQRATAAIVGFVLLFISYFLAQLLEVLFGIVIL